ncbi:hypothetical protein ACNKHR_17385 [Shigella flexneri]
MADGTGKPTAAGRRNGSIGSWLQEALSNVSDEAGLMRELRLFRRRITSYVSPRREPWHWLLKSILQQLGFLAETLIVAARDWLYDACCRESGERRAMRRAKRNRC